MGVLLKYEDQSRAYHTDDEHNGKAGLARFFDLDRHDKQRSVYKQEPVSYTHLRAHETGAEYTLWETHRPKVLGSRTATAQSAPMRLSERRDNACAFRPYAADGSPR